VFIDKAYAKDKIMKVQVCSFDGDDCALVNESKLWVEDFSLAIKVNELRKSKN